MAGWVLQISRDQSSPREASWNGIDSGYRFHQDLPCALSGTRSNHSAERPVGSTYPSGLFRRSYTVQRLGIPRLRHHGIRRDKPANVVVMRGVPVQAGGLVLGLAGELAVGHSELLPSVVGLVAHPVQSGEAAVQHLSAAKVVGAHPVQSLAPAEGHRPAESP